MSDEQTKFTLCEACGIDQETIKQRTRLFNLSKADEETCLMMNELVIEPNARSIINRYFHFLFMHDEFRPFIDEANINAIKQDRLRYLLSLGKDINTLNYFESRLRDGVNYHKSNLPLMLYQSGMQQLRTLILEKLPLELEQSMLIRLQIYVSKIISFDMSITSDSYIHDKVMNLKNSVVDLTRQSEKYKLKSALDPLTKVMNSETTRAAAAAAREKARNHHMQAGFIMFSFPDVIRINEQYGHKSGDQFIAAAVKSVRNAIPKGSQIGRYAANKFLIILSSKDTETSVRQLMTDMHNIVKGKSIAIDGEKLPLSLILAGRIQKDDEDIDTTIEKLGNKIHSSLNLGKAA